MSFHAIVNACRRSDSFTFPIEQVFPFCFFSINTLPEGFFDAFAILPCKPSSAITTEHLCKEACLSQCADFLKAMALSKVVSPFQLILRCLLFFFGNNGLVCLLDVVLIQCSIILDSHLGEEVLRVILLHQEVSLVLLVLQHSFDCDRCPAGFSRHTWNLFIIQVSGNLSQVPAFQKFSVDPFHYCSLFFIDDEVSPYSPPIHSCRK